MSVSWLGAPCSGSGNVGAGLAAGADRILYTPSRIVEGDWPMGLIQIKGDGPWNPKRIDA
jgi:hypothetical protein